MFSEVNQRTREELNREIKEIAAQLKDASKRLNIKQSDIAEKTGLTQASISSILNGRQTPSLEALQKISEALYQRLEHKIEVKVELSLK